MASTYIVFPITITMGAIFMQLGSVMIEKIHPRIQMAIGGIAIVIPLFVCSYTQSYGLFIFMYAVVIGFGFGVLYMVALRNAWQFFPSKKGMLSGIIMSSYSVGAILWVLITKQIANPNNLKPDVNQIVGDKVEHYFGADSIVVANVPLMLQTLGYCYLVMIALAVLLINKRVMPTIEQKHLPMMDGFSIGNFNETDRNASVFTGNTM